jgi:phospholipid/cholesterol/gamma-HCH transport system substrate-binding protein
MILLSVVFCEENDLILDFGFWILPILNFPIQNPKSKIQNSIMPPSNKSITFSRLRVGIFVFLGLLVLGFLIINSTGDFNPFEKRMKLRARFTTADGLRPGAQVQLAGIKIGTVDEVILLPPDAPEDEKIEAVMSVVQRLDGRPITERIRTDSTAQLVAMTMLANDKMINISPGTSKGDPVTENYIIESRDAMSISQLTQTGNDLLKEINRMAIPLNEILTKANQGEGTLGRFVNDETLYRNVDATVNETRATMIRLQTTIDRINRGDGTAGKLLNDPELYNNLNTTISRLDAISQDLRAGRGTAGKFLTDDALYNDSRAAIQDVRDAVTRLNQVAGNFDRIAIDLNEGRGTAGKFLKDEQLYEDARNTLARFNSTAARLDLILEDAQAGKGTLGKVLTDETLYNNINQTTANINQITTEGTKLIYDFRQNPRKYLRVRFSIF